MRFLGLQWFQSRLEMTRYKQNVSLSSIADGGEGFELLGSVDGVADQLSDEDIMIAVQELLDNRKDVFRLYAYIPLLHGK